MISDKIFKNAFWFLVLTGILNWIAYKLYLYWTVWWIDMVVHFLGGVTAGFIVLLLISKFGIFKQTKSSKILYMTLVGTIVIGILWEIFELYFGVTSLSDGLAFWTDTSSDLIMDTIGGIFAFTYTSYFLKEYKSKI